MSITMRPDENERSEVWDVGQIVPEAKRSVICMVFPNFTCAKNLYFKNWPRTLTIDLSLYCETQISKTNKLKVTIGVLKFASRSESHILEAQRTEICKTNYPIVEKLLGTIPP